MADQARAEKMAGQELRGVFSNYLSLLGMNAVALLLSFASTLALTRVLGPTGFGEWSVFTALVMAGIVIATNGTLTSLVRFGNEEYLLEGAIRRVFWARTVLLGATLLLVGFILWLADRWLPDALQELHIHWWVIFAAIVASALSLHTQHALQGAKRLKQVGLAQTAERAALLIAIAILAALNMLSVPAVVAAFISSGLIGALTILFLLKRDLWLPIGTDLKTIKTLLSFSLPYFILYPFGFLSSGYIDVLILKSFVSTQDVGLYAFAVQLIGVLLQVSTVAGVVLLPTMTSAIVLARHDLVTLYLKRLLPHIVFIWALILALALLVTPVFIRLLFGERFSGAITPFSIMLAACAFAIISQAGYSPAVNAYKLTWLNAQVGIASGVVNLLLDLLLIPIWGIAGAAWATCAAYLTTPLLFILFAGNKMRLDRNFAPLVCTLPLLAALTSNLLLHQPVWGAVLTLLVSVAVAWIMRLFNADAWQALRQFRAQRNTQPPAAGDGTYESLKRSAAANRPATMSASPAEPIKVVHFISSGARNWFLYPPIEQRDRKRFTITVGTLSPKGDLHADMRARGVRSFALGCTARRQYPLAVLRLARWLRQERTQVLQTHLYDAAMVGLLAARLAGTPLVIATNHHSHEVILQRQLRGKRLTLLVDTICNRLLAHYNIAPTAIIRDILLRFEGVPYKKIALIPYGFDFARLRANTDARERIRATLGLGANDVVIGSVGRLYWVKDHQSLLRAFAAISEQIADARLVIVGEGPEHAALLQLAVDLGIADRMVFTGFRADVPDVLAAMDIYVHSSLAEAFCVATGEAVALGKPMVCTDVGGVREVVKAGVNGFIVPPGDTIALQRAILTILQSADQWQQMAQAGREIVIEFSPERIARAYEDRYLQWLDQRGKIG